ncbi:MAG: nucleotide sugar dehydrogenase [Deltaproteobacteria bacterium]|nr:nucleotide sugar dehydrogenase [Deltaproteobacteria bacterium]
MPLRLIQRKQRLRLQLYGRRLILLKEKIKNKTARLGIIGLGYVGLPLAMEFAKAGFKVTGFDIDEEKIKKANKGESYIKDIKSAELAKEVKKRNFIATTDFDKLNRMDAISICVPTPLSKTKDPDMSYIIAAANKTAHHLRKGQLIVLESTTYPGTTEEVILPLLEKKGFKVGRDFYLGFSPERVDPGNKVYQTKNTPKVIGGITKKCLELASLVYGQAIEKIVPVSSTRAAEMVKILENTFRAINIGLANEVAIMCDKLDIDVWEVIDAAKTKPFGFMPFYPGPGLGGHCIPIDPSYLSWKMRTLNYNARFIELASEINSSMPQYVVNKIADALNLRGKAVKGANILIIGAAYKKDIDDIRESPALDIMEHLIKKGAKVSYNDPFVNRLRFDGHEFKSLRLTQKALNSADCAVIVTNHSSYNYEEIVKYSRLVMDTRNAAKGINSNKLVRL